ncbi:MAG: hypothetical protein HeimC3_17020 [Candidatus Heimdallarchaeota archaeon LC_3]|nr:MAG: hypothetical protein HeimC3_17020 [Candidatus Heimdallarchaeota archaeon LC_3]
MDFQSYKGVRSYNFNGALEEYPIDSYFLYLSFDELEKVKINSSNQIYVSVRNYDPEWKIYNINSVLDKNGTIYFGSYKNSTVLKISFNFSRVSTEIIWKLRIPLIIMLRIFAIHQLTTYKELISENEEENKEKRKMRFDIAKWILAFSSANIFLSSLTFSSITLETTLSLGILTLSAIYFYTAINLEGKMVKANNLTFIVTSLVLLFITVLILLKIFV